MNEWITKDELLAHVSEYGEHCYDAILHVNSDATLDLDSCYWSAIQRSPDGGKFMIIVHWGDE